MLRFLPFVLLASVTSLFGILWIVWDVDPFAATWYIFAILVILIFVVIFGFLGLLLYFVRIRFYRRYSVNWYIKTSFKMSFFVALFVAIMSTLALVKLISLINLIMAALAVSLLAFWSYLGKRV